MRELELPDGEDHRLRFVWSLAKDDVKILLSSPGSPLYRGKVFGTFASQIISMTGCMSRLVFDLVRQVPMDIKSKPAIAQILRDFEYEKNTMLLEIAEKKWIATIPPGSVPEVMNLTLDLLKRKNRLNRSNKPIYDHGLLLCDAGTKKLHVSSAIASSVLFQLYSEYVRRSPDRLSNHPEGAERGFAFQRQVLGRLNGPTSHYVSAKSFKAAYDTSHNRALQVSVSRTNVFTNLKEITRDDVHWTLWVNASDQYACDGIIVPPMEADIRTSPMIVLDTSVSDPFSADRREKVKRVHEKIIKPLMGRFKNVVGLYFYDKVLSTVNQAKTLKSCPPDTYVVDEEECRKLGVLY